MQVTRLKLSDLEPNIGQVEGLPINPRQWSKGDVESLAKSLLETPELFEARPIIVVPHDGKYVILGGNMRYEASRLNKAEDVPCFILPDSTPVDKMKEIVIKDNGAWGAWDSDILANEWGDLELGDWGVPGWVTGFSDSFDPNALAVPTGTVAGESKTGLESITFVFTQEDAQTVKDWMRDHSKAELSEEIVKLCQSVEAK